MKKTVNQPDILIVILYQFINYVGLHCINEGLVFMLT